MNHSLLDRYDDNIAFSLTTPKSVVNNWQSAFDALKQNGTFESIWNKWYGDVEIP